MVQRTWLFTPGDDRRKLARATGAAPDALIVDWEDGVDARRKPAARQATRALLEAAASRRLPGASDQGHAGAGSDARRKPSRAKRIGVRVNPAGTSLHARDLEAVAAMRPDFVMLPKVETAVDLEQADALGIALVVLVESARGLEAMPELASASEHVERLAFGALDFCADVHVTWRSPSPVLDYARVRMVVVSRAAGLAAPIDSVFPDLSDLDGLRAEAERSRQAGFGGKMVLHPQQLAPVVAAFAPEPEALERARRILAAYQAAEQRGSVVLEVDGSLVDAPLVRWARQVVADAEALPDE